MFTTHKFFQGYISYNGRIEIFSFPFACDARQHKPRRNKLLPAWWSSVEISSTTDHKLLLPFATATVNKLNRLAAFHAQFSSVSRKRIPPRRRKNRKCRTCADIEQQRSLPDVIGDLWSIPNTDGPVNNEFTLRASNGRSTMKATSW